MGKITCIKNNDIQAVLKNMSRQYLVGNLKRPQELSFIHDERLEIGITSYKGYAGEAAHRHGEATEFQYMISGWTQYLDTETGAVHEFIKGDFYVIHPNTSYAQKSKPGTVILFVKVPSINDKDITRMDESVINWLGERLSTVRTDHYHDENAPDANSIKPAAAVALFNERREMLMLRRADNEKWAMPGGTLEFGESLLQCALRETREECGLDALITDILGAYTDPNVKVAYSDGEVRQEFTIVYTGEVAGGNLKMDGESTAYRWIRMEDMDALPMAESQRKRIEDVKRYLIDGTKHFS